MNENGVRRIRYYCFLAAIVVSVGLVPLSAFCQPPVLEMGVRLNSEFKISLESNPTTGYKWEAKFDENFLKLQADTFFKPSEPRIGQGGTQTFEFLPVKSGETIVEFLYKRSWEKQQAQTKQYKVIVAP